MKKQNPLDRHALTTVPLPQQNIKLGQQKNQIPIQEGTAILTLTDMPVFINPNQNSPITPTGAHTIYHA